MVRWEYAGEPLVAGQVTERLNVLGAAGWELVTVTPAGVAIFKRPMGTGPEANAREAMYR